MKASLALITFSLLAVGHAFTLGKLDVKDLDSLTSNLVEPDFEEFASLHSDAVVSYSMDSEDLPREMSELLRHPLPSYSENFKNPPHDKDETVEMVNKDLRGKTFENFDDVYGRFREFDSPSTKQELDFPEYLPQGSNFNNFQL